MYKHLLANTHDETNTSTSKLVMLSRFTSLLQRYFFITGLKHTFHGLRPTWNWLMMLFMVLCLKNVVADSTSSNLPKTVNVTVNVTTVGDVKSIGIPRKLKLESVKNIISDDANPPQNTPYNLGAAWNAATQIKVYVLDESGNKIILPAGQLSKVKVFDENGVLDTASLVLDFAKDSKRRWAVDWMGDRFGGDVLKLGEASLIATIEGDTTIAASDPLKIKVVDQNLVARPYAGSAVPGDVAYGDKIAGIPAADAPYPSPNRYFPNTTNVIKDIPVGTLFKAFSIAVDGGGATTAFPMAFLMTTGVQ